MVPRVFRNFLVVHVTFLLCEFSRILKKNVLLFFCSGYFGCCFKFCENKVDMFSLCVFVEKFLRGESSCVFFCVETLFMTKTS